MDNGHHNCRDYYLKPEETLPVVPRVVSTASVLASRALRVSQKSPLNASSRKPSAFPFFKLPFELRRLVYAYLLPCTEEIKDTSALFFRQSGTRHNVLRNLNVKSTAGKDKIIWHRGQSSILAVCRQFHDECARLLYGESTFAIFVAYDSITFRFLWLLPNGLTPNKTFDFLADIPTKYLRLIKRLIVTVDHVDSYTGQIKFNVGGKGLTHGLRNQVARLVDALRMAALAQGHDKEIQDPDDLQGLRWLTLKLLNGNDHLDAEKGSMVRAREQSIRGIEEVQTVLEPLMKLKSLVRLGVSGAVTEEFVKLLELKTMGAN